MDYRESLDYLYGLQKFGIKLGLDNIYQILGRLHHPDQAYPIVHVAGSNGKGSVCAGLSSILIQAGRRTGLYSSPHLHSFTERIRIDGQAISEKEAVALIESVRAVCDGIPVTFFEFTTAMALLHFKRQKVEVAILEVGMGGRLDATNAVKPQVTVITPICLDHSEHLGTDLAAIAFEKAGIIKPQVPLVVGQQQPASLHVLNSRAKDLQVPVYCDGRDFTVKTVDDGFDYQGLGLSLTGLKSGLHGVHQHHNLGVALATAELLQRQGLDLPTTSLREGVAAARWPGRLEWWQEKRTVLLDGAHNEGGAKVLAAYLESLSVVGIRWVVGAKATKDIANILRPVIPLVDSLYCTVPPVEEAVPAESIAQLAVEVGVQACCFDDLASALAAALADRQQGEIVMVAGSLFLVAAAREYLMSLEGA
jgi:dihydrofolate synthase/folylpolyglutamate synthase